MKQIKKSFRQRVQSDFDEFATDEPDISSRGGTSIFIEKFRINKKHMRRHNMVEYNGLLAAVFGRGC